jgi:hypothetical protein
MIKRLIITLSILILLGISLPGLPIFAQPAKTPHENPDRALATFDSAGLLLSYSQIASQATNSQYQNTRDILKALEKVNLPDDVRNTFNQYNSLNQNLITTLDKLESFLNETNDLLSHNRVEEAGHSLDSSEGVIQDAEYLLKDTQASTRSLSEKLGVFTSSATNRLSQSYARLDESATSLSSLIAKLKNIRADLNKRYTKMTELTPTTLSLSFNQESVSVGDDITAAGRLECPNGPLTAKKIALMTDNLSAGTAVTGPDGAYIANIIVPFLYKDNILFTAQYEPSDEDSNVFLASQSLSINMSTKFYPTRLDMAVPETIYRGLPLTLNGEVSTDQNNISRLVTVYLDDLELAEVRVSGRFSFEVTIPPDATLGWRNLRIWVAPAGRYAGALKTPSINLSAMSLRIETQSPALIFLPASLRISGKIFSGSNPLTDAPVVIKLMNSTTTVKTGPGGGFSASIKAQNWYPIGLHNLEITTEMPGSSTMTQTVKREMLTIHPLSAAPGALLIIWPALVLYRRKRTHKAPVMEIITRKAVKLPVEVQATARLAAPVIKFTGIKGRVLSAYLSGLTIIEKITGIIIAPSATLREFLKTSRPLSPAAAAQFAELTAIAESSLYSAVDPPDIIAARAEELADILKEELRREHP